MPILERCLKLKFFYCLLVFCAVNVVLYRYFIHRTPVSALLLQETKADGTHQREWYLQGNNETRQILSFHSRTSDESVYRRTSTENVLEFVTTPGLIDNDVGKSSTRRVPTTGSLFYVETATSDGRALTDQDMLLSKTVSINVSLESAVPGLSLCPLIPPKLVGPLAVLMTPLSWEEIANSNPGLEPGGRYRPPDCLARHRVAIIIPYRNREVHLKILLTNLHPMLMRQQLDYGIFVIDQAMPGMFNRAMLMNIGYREAMKRDNFQCAIFHDVDLVPEHDRNIYSCPDMPRHLSAAIDKFNYRLPYSAIYGGASAMRREQFEQINGFSNMFFGWGGEDDDMARRIFYGGLNITRYPMEIARYKMIKHVHESGNEVNPLRFALLKSTKQRMKVDGLNSLVYDVQRVETLPTHLRIQVLIREKDILKEKVLKLLSSNNYRKVDVRQRFQTDTNKTKAGLFQEKKVRR